MARVRNPLLVGVSGKFGTTTVYKQYAYGTVQSRYPDMTNIVPTEAQKKQRDHFRRANAYAMEMLQRPEKVLEYKRKARKGKQLRQVAMKEFYDAEKELKWKLEDELWNGPIRKRSRCQHHRR